MAEALLVMTCGAVAQAWWSRLACGEAREKRNDYGSNLEKKTEEFHVIGIEILQFQKVSGGRGA